MAKYEFSKNVILPLNNYIIIFKKNQNLNSSSSLMKDGHLKFDIVGLKRCVLLLIFSSRAQ